MHLIQILLPLYDNAGHRYGREHFDRLRTMLLETFGGLTAYTRAPAEGLWEAPAGSEHRDEIVILEVMTPALDRTWWADLRGSLERGLQQESIVIRMQQTELL